MTLPSSTDALAAPSASPSELWALPESSLSVFHGHSETPRLFHYFLPRLVGQGKRVLCLDGANRFDPLLIARFVRRVGHEPLPFNQYLRVARAFTCFQLTELLVRATRLLRDFPAETLIVTALPDLYFDEDVREAEAAASFRHALAALRALEPLRLTVAVFSDAESFHTSRGKFFRQLKAQANHVWRFTEKEDGKLSLSGERSATPQPRALP
jgi:hypothetical protein